MRSADAIDPIVVTGAQTECDQIGDCSPPHDLHGRRRLNIPNVRTISPSDDQPPVTSDQVVAHVAYGVFGVRVETYASPPSIAHYTGQGGA